ncbi:MAG: hypothetical protein NTV49_14730, partial [Kiritimatiellaeota bacterium]|nr:hypothetical protein [Kiritimatiellota bacterium]
IIVDGDCFMHHKYVESTLLLAEDRTVLCGRRVNLDRTISEALRSGKITPYSFSRNYIYRVFELFRRGTKKIEEGIYIHPPSFFYKCLKYKHKGKAALLGCSWSAPTSLIFEVNGFDEDYNVPTAGEDTDIEMRMRRAGMKFSMVKNAAIVYHLFHATKYDKESNRIAIAILKGRDKNATMCKNGLKKV